jgi:hypothetical protein
MTLFSSAFASPSRVKLSDESGLDCTLAAYERAAGKHADIAVFATAHELGMKYTAATMAGAAQCNKLAEVQFLHTQGCSWPARLLDEAASSGYIELMRWCHEHGCTFCEVDLVPCFAAESGNVELMAWVLQQLGMQLTALVMRSAALKGHIAMVQYFHAQQCPWDESCTSAAASLDHADLLRWLVENECPWNASVLRMCAVQGGSVEVLVYLQHLGVLTTVETLTDSLNMAAVGNKLDAAKWLREQGADWPAGFSKYPLQNEVLEWARAEGCPMNRYFDSVIILIY